MLHFLAPLFHPLSLHHASYVGLFFLLGGTGLYAPIPDELTLLTAGYLLAQGTLSIFITLPIAIAGGLVVDSVLYVLARTGATYAKRLRDRTLTHGLEKTWIFSPSHPLRTIFFLRFFVGIRILGPLFAGFNKISWPKFALVSVANMAIYFSFILWIGYTFHNTLPHIIRIFRIARTSLLIFFGVLLVAILVFLAYKYLRIDTSKIHKD
jgi:membrane protein DedA with SNARE-associated domain